MRKRDLAEPRLGTTMVERRRRRLGGNGDNGLPKADSLSNPEHDQEHNPYLALRQAKIARNQARLEELGLVGCGSVVGGGGSDTRISKGCSSSGSGHIAKSAPLNRKITAQKTAQPRKHGLRRSTRLSDKANRSTFGTYKVQRPRGREPNENYEHFHETVDAQCGHHGVSQADPECNNNPPNNVTPSPQKMPPNNSVRTICIDIHDLLFGRGGSNEHEKGVLGLSATKTGKEFIIHQAFQNAASQHDLKRLTGARLSFNKYSGVQEWKSACFLWINLGGKGGSVENQFLDGGRKVTWFGGSRMHDNSLVIQRLLDLGTSDPSNPSIVLWCRTYQPAIKAFGPYVCFGRLSYHSHIPGSQPLSFVWNLVDFELLNSSNEEIVRKTFQNAVRGGTG